MPSPKSLLTVREMVEEVTHRIVPRECLQHSTTAQTQLKYDSSKVLVKLRVMQFLLDIVNRRTPEVCRWRLCCGRDETDCALAMCNGYNRRSCDLLSC